MYRERIKNLNIDQIAKTLDIVPQEKRSIDKIEWVKIESTLDLKKDRGPLGDIKHLVKRNRFKLMKLLGQEPKWVLSRKSVAEWKLRKGMVIGNYLTIRGEKNIERFWKLWALSSQVRENKITKWNTISEEGKRGIESEGVEWLILVNDWPMSDSISISQNWIKSGENYEKINEELRELKLMDLGMNIGIKWMTDKRKMGSPLHSGGTIKNKILKTYKTKFKFSYMLLPQ